MMHGHKNLKQAGINSLNRINQVVFKMGMYFVLFEVETVVYCII